MNVLYNDEGNYRNVTNCIKFDTDDVQHHVLGLHIV